MARARSAGSSSPAASTCSTQTPSSSAASTDSSSLVSSTPNSTPGITRCIARVPSGVPRVPGVRRRSSFGVPSQIHSGATTLEDWEPQTRSNPPIPKPSPTPRLHNPLTADTWLVTGGLAINSPQWCSIDKAIADLRVARTAPKEQTLLDCWRTARAGPLPAFKPTPCSSEERPPNPGRLTTPRRLQAPNRSDHGRC
jgi:hypothetical protein